MNTNINNNKEHSETSLVLYLVDFLLLFKRLFIIL